MLECVHAGTAATAPGDDEAAVCAALGLQVLTGLSSTRRFDMLLMFLDDKQKRLVRTVFAEMKRLGQVVPPAVAKAWEQK